MKNETKDFIKYIMLPITITTVFLLLSFPFRVDVWSKPESQFHYKEKINVIGGFYKGHTGIVNEEFKQRDPVEYMIILNTEEGFDRHVVVEVNNLEKIK